MKRQAVKTGFTIIEMTIALAFVSLLMIAIGYLVIYLGNLYQRGISLKDVNKTADLIISDIQSSTANYGELSCAYKLISRSQMSFTSSSAETCRKLFEPDTNTTEITGAALCTGKVSYVWNYGYALDTTGRFAGQQNKLFRYNALDSAGNRRSKLVRLVKIRDEGRRFCNAGNLQSGGVVILSDDDNSLATTEDVTELIEGNDRDLALHSFSVIGSAPDAATGQALYEIEFVLGTFREGLLMTNNAQCKNLAESQSGDDSQKVSKQDLSYCAINKFNFAVRATEGKGVW